LICFRIRGVQRNIIAAAGGLEIPLGAQGRCSAALTIM
jgi:hypothetical protein